MILYNFIIFLFYYFHKICNFLSFIKNYTFFFYFNTIWAFTVDNTIYFFNSTSRSFFSLLLLSYIPYTTSTLYPTLHPANKNKKHTANTNTTHKFSMFLFYIIKIKEKEEKKWIYEQQHRVDFFDLLLLVLPLLLLIII